MITKLSKPIRRLALIGAGGGGDWKNPQVVTLSPGAEPFLTFRAPGRRSCYSISLAKCMDLAEKAAAVELMKARRAARAARKAADNGKK